MQFINTHALQIKYSRLAYTSNLPLQIQLYTAAATMTTNMTTTRIEKKEMSTKKAPKKKSSSSFQPLIRSGSHRGDDTGDDLLCKETRPHYLFFLCSDVCVFARLFFISPQPMPLLVLCANFPIGLVTAQCGPTNLHLLLGWCLGCYVGTVQQVA